MSLVTSLLEGLERPRARRFSYKEYRRLVDEGFFEADHVELIDGEVLTTPAMSGPHNMAVLLGRQVLEAAFGAGYVVRPQMPIDLEMSDSSPEPDLAVVRGSPREYLSPPKRVLLLVEVAVTSLDYDLGAKAALYATGGVEDYWVVDVVGRRVVVHRGPQAARGAFATVEVFSRLDQVQPLHEAAAVLVADLLP